MGEPRTIRGTNLTAAEGGGLSGPLRAWDGDGGTDMNLMSGAGCRDADGSYTYGWMDKSRHSARQSGTRRELVALIWYVAWTITLHILYRYDGYALSVHKLQRQRQAHGAGEVDRW